MNEAMTDLSQHGAIFPACRRCGRALYAVPGGVGKTAHIEQDTEAINCEQRGVDELVADHFASDAAMREKYLVRLLNEAHDAWAAIERTNQMPDRIRLDRVLDPANWTISESHDSGREGGR